MNGKIGLEEHFAIPETLDDSAGFVPGAYWKELSRRLLDMHEGRLREMDQNGMEMMVLSLNAPTVQAIPSIAKAHEIAVRANDFLAEQVAKRPDRFQAFAALPLQDPDLATRELERCVKQLGFKGALVNGFSQTVTPNNCVYYDAPQFADFWQCVETLDVPFYLHPRNPIGAWAQIYDGHPWLLGPTWAFGSTGIPNCRSFWGIWAKGCRTACGVSTIATPGSIYQRRIQQKRRLPSIFKIIFTSLRRVTSIRKR
jgi:predicted TIM-barrel fold metal-dependent hydrolase